MKNAKVNSSPGRNALVVAALLAIVTLGFAPLAHAGWGGGWGCYPTLQAALNGACAWHNPDSTSVPGTTYYKDSCVYTGGNSATVNAHAVSPTYSWTFSYGITIGNCSDCPANMSGSPCACNAGFIPAPNGAQGCVPAYTLILSAGTTSIEPWSAKRDPQHRKSNVAMMAVVVDSNGVPQANVDLEAAVDVNTDLTVYDDGHRHTDGRPRGKLLDTQSGIADAPSTLSGSTDANGMLTFYFGAEQAAGQHTITVQCGHCSNGPQKAKINVEFAGLGRLGDDNTCHKFFCLRGGETLVPDNHHADNHYYTTRAMYNVVMLSYYYYMEFQSDIPPAQRKALLINDSSLKKGGVYDYHNNWKNPHKLHRQGIVVDINNYHQEDAAFVDFAEGHGVFPKWEPPSVSPTPHYHLRLLGQDRDE